MSRLLPILKDQQGSTLTTTVLLVAVLTVLGVTMAQLIDTQSSLVTVDVTQVRSFYSGQAGLEYGIRRAFQSANWHWTESNLPIAGSSVTVFAEDSTLLPSLHDTLQVTAVATNGQNGTKQRFRTRLFDISQFAIYVSGDVNDVTVRDSAGNINPGLAYEFATNMPEMDTDLLKTIAIQQGHYFSGSLSLSNGSVYPSGQDTGFYHVNASGVRTDTPNVVYIEGDLEVKNSATISGIIVVNGDVALKNSQKLQGVLYLPDPVSVVEQSDVDLHNKETVYGAIYGGANVEGLGNETKINVYYRRSYIVNFFSRFSGTGTPYVTYWRQWHQYY